MNQKPSLNFWGRMVIAFNRYVLIWSEVFFWELIFGIISAFPNNSAMAQLLGEALGIRLASVALFQLPRFLYWLYKPLDVSVSVKIHRPE